jgi:NitT/TauT family transport system permease protein
VDRPVVSAEGAGGTQLSSVGQTTAVAGSGPGRSPLAALRTSIAASPWTYRLLTVVIVGGIWEAYSRSIHSLLIPTFSGTVLAVAQQIVDPAVLGAFALSNEALVYGFFIAVAVGIPLGLAAARFSGIEAFTDPYLSILLVVPMASLIPLLLMSPLGISTASRVTLVFLFSIPILIVNARAGVRQIDPGLIEMATSFGATERQIWRRILLPGSLPAIMTGVRLGLGRAVTAMVIVELLMYSVGIGGLILRFRGFFMAEELYGVVVLVVFEALILISLARALERRIAPWAKGTTLRG